MNPSGLDQDSLRGKKINQYKSIAFCLQMCNFRAQLIVQIYYNLLLYWLGSISSRYGSPVICPSPNYGWIRALIGRAVKRAGPSKKV